MKDGRSDSSRGSIDTIVSCCSTFRENGSSWSRKLFYRSFFVLSVLHCISTALQPFVFTTTKARTMWSTKRIAPWLHAADVKKSKANNRRATSSCSARREVPFDPQEFSSGVSIPPPHLPLDTSEEGGGKVVSAETTISTEKKNGFSLSNSNKNNTTIVDQSSSLHDNTNGERNGKESNLNGVLKEPSATSNGQQQELNNFNDQIRNNSTVANSHTDAPTAPEVKHWTDIMSQGWNDSMTGTPTTAWDTVLSDFDLQEIEKYWDSIMPTVSYLGTEHVAKIYQALCVAYRAHRGQFRKSGEPFIIHPVQVSLLLSGLKMDSATVMSGLLHDTVEDTDLDFAQVEALFGHTVRTIVEGETKVSKLPKLALEEYQDEQAENLRQMFVAMTEDYRIIIVKLADRLHNMRTLKFMKRAKQIKISRETLDIFAPLAHRMGIWQFKSELEDTAFMYLYPGESLTLKRRLREHQSKFRETLDKSQVVLQRRLFADPTLQQQAAKVEVFGRTKEIYSLWHKMQTKDEQDLNRIGDVVALRVVITPNEELNAGVDDDNHETDQGVWLCYHVLGLVQHLPGFQPLPTRVKDYISFPKPNGYQSLHTALMLNGQTIEVQIRTSMMHQVAEFGMASHWAYKDMKRRQGGSKNQEELYNTPWLSSIKEWQNDMISSRDFVDSVRSELLGKRVFVFLRNGKILNLARGATAIDAAFQIHTEVGLSMHGVDVNGKPVPFSYELQNGDVVSILTGKGKPATDWMRYAKSRSTRSKLRSYFRARQKESLREAGNILLTDYLWKHGELIENASYLERDFVAPTTVQGLAPFLPGKSRYQNVEELLLAVGKHHDRYRIHRVMSQIFSVPKKVLVAAEENNDRSQVIPRSVAAAVRERRQQAQEAAQCVASASESYPLGDEEDENSTIEEEIPQERSSTFSQVVDSNLETHVEPAAWAPGSEYADEEQLCQDCLPVRGDPIIGTRPPHENSITVVHRVGCPHATRARNALKRNQVDSVTLRRRNGSVWNRRQFTKAANDALSASTSEEVPVRLQWSDTDSVTSDDTRALFKAEIVVHAVDRKLLLADCSIVVSETAEILQTGSYTTEEHAKLIFLVQVSDLDHLQRLMDRLGDIESVMSVERRFGSKLS